MRQLLILLILVLGFQFHAIAFSPSEFYNVSANSGLNLRLSPGNGVIIKKLYLGDRVEILEDIDCLGFMERIEWVDGEWIRVKHNEDIGYVFSGFLTTLPIPISEGEYTHGNQLIHPFEQWIENNFEIQAAKDSFIRSNLKEVAIEFEEGSTLKKIITPSQVHLEFEVGEVEIMELYQILFAMLTEKSSQQHFLRNSVFVEDYSGEINKVDILIGNESFKIFKDREGISKITLTKHLQTSMTS